MKIDIRKTFVSIVVYIQNHPNQSPNIYNNEQSTQSNCTNL
jgi:hypothetical protein